MRKQIIIILIMAVAIRLSLYSQQISGVTARQIDKKIEVNYNLMGKTGIKDYEIKFYVSTDGGISWEQLYTGITGDVGRGVTAGYNKSIIWDVLATRDKLQGTNIRFKVTATFSENANYTETYAGLNIEMVYIKGGTFTMGCTPVGDSDCEGDEKTTQQVSLTDYYLSKTEITNAQFCQFLNEKGNQTEGGREWIDLSGSYDGEKCRIYQSGSRYYVQSGYDNYPVIYVSWYGARAFANWLSDKTGKKYSLPTEAQWEYACRSGGKSYKYTWGNGNPTRANGGNIADETFKARYSNWTIWQGYTDGYVYTAPVGSFGTNELGLADMSGNVWEWSMDVYSKSYSGTSVTNPCNDCSNSSSVNRVNRGGSWDGRPQNQRCSYRYSSNPDDRSGDVGFRLCRMN